MRAGEGVFPKLEVAMRGKGLEGCKIAEEAGRLEREGWADGRKPSVVIMRLAWRGLFCIDTFVYCTWGISILPSLKTVENTNSWQNNNFVMLIGWRKLKLYRGETVCQKIRAKKKLKSLKPLRNSSLSL